MTNIYKVCSKVNFSSSLRRSPFFREVNYIFFPFDESLDESLFSLFRSICCSPDQELENEKLKEKDLRVLWAKKNKNRLNNEIRANRQKHFKDPTGLLR